MNTYNTLLFFTSNLDPTRQHQLTMTLQDNGVLAIDYIIVVGQTSNGVQGTVGPSVGPSGEFTSAGSGLGTASSAAGPGVTGSSTQPTAVFPGSTESTTTHTGGNTTAVIGGILGAAVGLVSWKSAILPGPLSGS